MIGEILSEIKHQLPKFNDDVIIGLRKREVEGLLDFIAERYKECCIVADENLEFIGYSILSPNERLIYELTDSKRKKNNISIKSDEAILAVYNFKYYDQTFKVPIYVPYIYENSSIIVNNTQHECLLNMTEKLFSVRSRSKGITIKVIRSPISCHKNILHTFNDEVTNEQFVGSIVSCKIYYKKLPKSKKTKPTIIHYLLCKFSLEETLSKFGINPDHIKFIESEDFSPDHYYFKIKNTSTDQIYLKVNKDAMNENRVLYDIVATIIYILSSFRFITYNELISDSKTIFRIILGKLIHSNNTNRIQALSHMTRHIESVDTYLDNYNKGIFKAGGIIVNDIYDLFVFIQTKIGAIIIDYPSNNMYNKRIEAINNVIVDGLVKTLNLNIYGFERKADFGHMFKSISRAFSVHPKIILKNLSNNESVRFSSSGIYGDNWLLSIGDKVIKRLSASIKPSKQKDGTKTYTSGINSYANKFHPSMISIESAIGFSSKPGSNCLINPYVRIDETGGFLKPESIEEIDKIKEYLENTQKGLIGYEEEEIEELDKDDEF